SSAPCNPNELVAFACGSRSISKMRWPSSASAAPRLTAVVVFPTPPFWFASATILMTPRSPDDVAGRVKRKLNFSNFRSGILKVDFVLGHYPGIRSTSFQAYDCHDCSALQGRDACFMKRPKSKVERINAAGANLIHLRAA